MAVPQDTVWPADDHTIAKHAILRGYLDAWFGILGSTHGRVVYVDGFSGPGKYAGGEPGSPVIALEAAKAHTTRFKNEVVFLFSDERADRIEHLRAELAQLELPSTFSIYAEVGRFDEFFTAQLDQLDAEGDRLAPTFVFMDPFGFSGVPFELVSRILRNPHCEVFITFMVNAVQRFLDHPADAIREEIIRLLGSAEAPGVLASAGNRVEAVRSLYQKQLEAEAAFVRSFEIRDSPGHILYYLFFASNHRLGHLKMKEAMWGADPSGRFQFVDNTVTDQLVLLDEDPIAPLVPRLRDRFTGETASGDDVLDYVADNTPFVEKHAREALKRLEESAGITVDAVKSSGKKRRAGSFPRDSMIRFH